MFFPQQSWKPPVQNGLKLVEVGKAALASVGLRGPFRMRRLRCLPGPQVTWFITLTDSKGQSFEAEFEDQTGALTSLKQAGSPDGYVTPSRGGTPDPTLQRWVSHLGGSAVQFAGSSAAGGVTSAFYRAIVHGHSFFEGARFGILLECRTRDHSFLSFLYTPPPPVEDRPVKISKTEVLAIYKKLQTDYNAHPPQPRGPVAKYVMWQALGDPGEPSLVYYQTNGVSMSRRPVFPNKARLTWMVPILSSRSRSTPSSSPRGWIYIDPSSGEVLSRL